MSAAALLADVAPVSDLLDVFSTYGGEVLFRGLVAGASGGPGLLGQVGWLFTALGAVVLVWGFVLRTRGGGADDRLGEIARTWIILGVMLGGPVLVKASLEASDGIYAETVGGPQKLTTACVKAAYALPELNALFDALRKNAEARPSGAAIVGPPPAAPAADGTVMGYLKAYGTTVWGTATGYARSALDTWNGLLRVISLLAGLGAAMLKCLLIILTLAPLYLLLMASAALVWFMEQFRYFLAVTGTMMLPLFVGLFSLPAGHPGRSIGQAYAMNLLSVTLWPVAWAVGHTGTLALYDALVSLIAGTSRVPELATVLQWSAITGGVAPDQAQVAALEAALGNWFMGNAAALLSILVGGAGFALWVACVTVLGPVFLHKLLTAGALFMGEGLSATGGRAVGAGRMIAGAVPIHGLVARVSGGLSTGGLGSLEAANPIRISQIGAESGMESKVGGEGAGRAGGPATLAQAAEENRFKN